ncbi:MAG: antibiotic biosynthesis monooxygenase [Mucilaginibacter polytrichastri]|nr:antibiotic biosynthesis monooxygenase [Mucilaginibacter polytrichastri]
MRKNLTAFSILILLTLFCSGMTLAQKNDKMIRIARITVDPAQLDAYKTALKEGVEAAVSKEPGVITLYAVYDKKQPTHVTVFEVYADRAAYETHIMTSHFLKYKNGTKDMVKSLELIDVDPIALATKP